MSKASAPKISVTKNYRLFGRSAENRPLDLKKHRKLEESMKEYGFLSCFPIVCLRGSEKELVVKDGQHRLAIAETLGLPVYWVEDTVDFDVAKINNAAKGWVVVDYARKFASNGIKDYEEGLRFAETHHLPAGIAFAMLGGYTGFTAVRSAYESGRFKIKDRAWAEAVANLYVPTCRLSHSVSNARFLHACMMACRVKEFDANRFLHNAERCREKLVQFGSTDAYLQMMEEVYNFNRSKMLPLRVFAQTAMRERNAVVKKRQQAAARRAAAASAA